jgi:hypothetical protein
VLITTSVVGRAGFRMTSSRFGDLARDYACRRGQATTVIGSATTIAQPSGDIPELTVILG